MKAKLQKTFTPTPADIKREWFLVDAGLQILGAANVPLYSTLLPPQIAYIVGDSGSKVVMAPRA